jgi:hypothetical protein
MLRCLELESFDKLSSLQLEPMEHHVAGFLAAESTAAVDL